MVQMFNKGNFDKLDKLLDTYVYNLSMHSLQSLQTIFFVKTSLVKINDQSINQNFDQSQFLSHIS